MVYTIIRLNKVPTICSCINANSWFLFALTLFHTSVRRGNFKFLSVAMHKLSAFSYRMNMISYLEITIMFEDMLNSTHGNNNMHHSKHNMPTVRSPEQSLRWSFILEAVNKIEKYALKRVSFGSKDCTKELKLERAYFLGKTS